MAISMAIVLKKNTDEDAEFEYEKGTTYNNSSAIRYNYFIFYYIVSR